MAPSHPGSRWHERFEGVEIYRYPVAATGSGLIGHLMEYALALPASAVMAGLAHVRRRVDVLHAANPPDFFFPLAMIFRSHGAAFIFDHHDPAPELYLAQGGQRGGIVYRFLRWCEQQTLRTADVVVATNESIRGIAMGRGRVAPERVIVVRSSVDLARTFRVAPDQRLKAGRAYLVVYLGVMGPQDGLDLFVRTAGEVSRRLPGAVRFVAIGDGSERSGARALAARLGLEDEVDFPGRLSDERVRTLLSTADLAVGPDPLNGFNELCTMNKTLEYMAMGIPLVCFDLAETRVSAGDAAMYARPNDPIDLARCAVEVLTSVDRGASMGQTGRARMAGQLSWEKSVTQLRRAYALGLAAARARRR